MINFLNFNITPKSYIKSSIFGKKVVKKLGYIHFLYNFDDHREIYKMEIIKGKMIIKMIVFI
jgi:hypothetical protein